MQYAAWVEAAHQGLDLVAPQYRCVPPYIRAYLKSPLSTRLEAEDELRGLANTWDALFYALDEYRQDVAVGLDS